MAKPRQIGHGLFYAAGFFAVFLFSGSVAHAAGSLFIDPPSGTFTVGSTFTVSIYVNTDGQYVNAVQADLTFPPDKLQVVSPTTGKSIFQIWVSQPAYSNTDGTMRFRGTIPTPGISTKSGLISTVTFRVKETGTAVVKIADTSKILLNDGKGTDVLGSTTDGLYYLTLPPPAGPDVVSPTNPDQETWYATKNVVFRWNAPADSEGVSYILNNLPIDEPDDISEGTQSFVNYKDLPDGIYYFHIKSLRQGVWGGVTNYAVKIDNAPPAAFDIDISPGDTTTNKRPIFDFLTTDAASGIDHYELKFIALDPPAAQAAANDTPFFIEASSPFSNTFDIGRYDIIVRAYDAAGNYYQATKEFRIIRPIFEVLGQNGVRIGGVYTIGWPYAAGIGILLLAILAYFARTAWIWHRNIERELEAGAQAHPRVAAKLEELRQKQKEYPGPPGSPGVKSLIIFLIAGALLASGAHRVFADAGSISGASALEPPIVSLFPPSISNDEILYIGGRAAAPNAQVLVYLQNIETGGTLNETATTDKDGAWFYSFPQSSIPDATSSGPNLKCMKR